MIDIPKGIRNIIFDMGGVIVELDIPSTIQAFEKLGVDVSSKLGTSIQKGFIHQYEIGEITTEEFRTKIKELTTQPISDSEIDEAWNKMLYRITPERVSAIATLKRKYNTYLLSNINDLHWQRCKEMIEAHGVQISECFDQTFCSHELHCSKPSPIIFERALAMAGIVSEETLFLDDSEANCRQASQLGIVSRQTKITDLTLI